MKSCTTGFFNFYFIPLFYYFRHSIITFRDVTYIKLTIYIARRIKIINENRRDKYVLKYVLL